MFVGSIRFVGTCVFSVSMRLTTVIFTFWRSGSMLPIRPPNIMQAPKTSQLPSLAVIAGEPTDSPGSGIRQRHTSIVPLSNTPAPNPCNAVSSVVPPLDARISVSNGLQVMSSVSASSPIFDSTSPRVMTAGVNVPLYVHFSGEA
jgi:hypothetical protein